MPSVPVAQCFAVRLRSLKAIVRLSGEFPDGVPYKIQLMNLAEDPWAVSRVQQRTETINGIRCDRGRYGIHNGDVDR